MMPSQAPTSLLLVLPLPIFRADAEWMIDRQAHNGLHRWLDNFDRVTLCMPVQDVSAAPPDVKLFLESDFGGRLRLLPLPERRKPLSFALALPGVARELGQQIETHTHLCFAIGGLFGDWAAVAALLASRKGRAAAVWTDRVESQVAAVSARRMSGAKRIYGSVVAAIMQRFEQVVIRRSAIGLFHGADCFAAYAPFSSNPHLVHDIHLGEDARISPAELERKGNRAGTPKIVYAGRVHPDKGPLDWVETLRLTASRGQIFTATWYGDGPQLEDALRAVEAGGLGDRVRFAGMIADRALLMENIRDADIFLFCHKTLESPRCLIEALINGTPIVGYASRYPEDLIKGHGGGILTSMDPDALSAALASLLADRVRRSELVVAAAADGGPITDAAVFRHRSDLIKAGTPKPPSPPRPSRA